MCTLLRISLGEKLNDVFFILLEVIFQVRLSGSTKNVCFCEEGVQLGGN